MGMIDLKKITLKKVNIDKTPLFVGDIHGEYDKLILLLEKAGFKKVGDQYISDKYELVSVGDLVDKGPKNLKVLEMKIKYAVLGNHDYKILRWLNGHKVSIGHGNEKTINELESISEDKKFELLSYLNDLPLQLIINDKYLVVHGGMKDDHLGAEFKKASKSCLYGLPTGELDINNLPIRSEWYKDYSLPYICIYGHTQQENMFVYNNTYNIDTGCVYGNKLTAFDYENNILYEI